MCVLCVCGWHKYEITARGYFELPLRMCARKLMRAHSMFDYDFVHRNEMYIFWANCAASAAAAAALLCMVMCIKRYTQWASERVLLLVWCELVNISFLCLLFQRRYTHWGHTLRRSELRSLAILYYLHTTTANAQKKRDTHTRTHVRALHLTLSPVNQMNKWFE